MSENRRVPWASFVAWAANGTKITNDEQAEVSLVLEDQLARSKLLLTEPKARDKLFVS